MKESTVNFVLKALPFTMLVISVLIGIVCAPLLLIAMVNLLFPTACIAYGFVEWCAVVVILLILKFDVNIKS